MVKCTKTGVQTPGTRGAEPSCKCYQSHHNEMTPLPATSRPSPALPASFTLLTSGTLVSHPQALGWATSSLTYMGRSLLFFLPFLMWMLPLGPYFWSLGRSVFHSFIHPPIIQHEWVLSHVRCKGYSFKTIPHESRNLVKDTRHKPIRETTNHDGTAGIQSVQGERGSLSPCLLLSALMELSCSEQRSTWSNAIHWVVPTGFHQGILL